MAEITSGDDRRKQTSHFSKPKKYIVSIDMTPMVDLGFLLITFFIFTSTMSQPTSMNLTMPNEDGNPTPIKESGALTFLPGAYGNIYYYEGSNLAKFHTSSLKEIRNVIVDKKNRTPEKDFIVVIKPTEKANYGNVIDVLDEMKISDVKRYALVDISLEEKKYFQ